jgi:LPXTG-motif cell wall-anchored protein
MRNKFMRTAAIAATAMLSLTTVFSGTAIQAYADGTTVTITHANDSNATHTYAAYKIFKGTVKESTVGSTTTKTLTDIAWADDTAGTAILAALKADETFGKGTENSFYKCTTAADVAEVMSKITGDAETKELAQVIGANLPSTASATSTNGAITGLDNGYYLIKDTANPASITNATAADKNSATTLYILQVVGESALTVEAKSAIPSLIKKVAEGDYKSTDSEKSSYGDTYNDVADYSIGDDINLQLYGTLPSDYAEYDTYYYQFVDTEPTGISLVDTDGDGEFDKDDITVTIGVGGTVIDSQYYDVEKTDDGFTVTFTDLTQVSGVTKDSTIVVTYTAELNDSAVLGNSGNISSAKLVYSNNPNDGTTSAAEKGETPVDSVVVLTYQLKITKIDGNDKSALENVQFKLKKGNNYVTATNGVVTGFTDSADKATTFTTDSNGLISIVGLEDGTYTLVETQPLSGYNTIADTTLTITAVTKNGQTYTTAVTDPLTSIALNNESGDASQGLVTETVKNYKGTTLPTTGGMGTTVLYIIGGVMICGAGIVLVVRRRVKNETAK